MLCGYLNRSGSLTSLVVNHSGVSDLAGAAIMAAVAQNTALKTLDLSGNDIGGTSDLLAAYHHDHGGRGKEARHSSRWPPITRAARKTAVIWTTALLSRRKHHPSRRLFKCHTVFRRDHSFRVDFFLWCLSRPRVTPEATLGSKAPRKHHQASGLFVLPVQS